MNTPRSQAISTSWIRDALFELYKDYNGLPQDVFKDEVLPQQSDATVRKLYDKGFCGDEFRKAKETFFVSDFPDVPARSGPMPGFEKGSSIPKRNTLLSNSIIPRHKFLTYPATPLFY